MKSLEPLPKLFCGNLSLPLDANFFETYTHEKAPTAIIVGMIMAAIVYLSENMA
jgi:hypothetical protein